MIKLDLGFNRSVYILTTLVALILFFGCGDRKKSAYIIQVPPTFDSLPGIPDYNPMNGEKVEFGRKLFNDKRLSADGNISCASCHLEAYAYSDTVAVSPGVHGRLDRRNAYGLVNVAYQKALFMEGGVPNLELQAMAPFFNENEMGFNPSAAAKRIRNDENYMNLSELAFGTDSIDSKVVAYSLAAFQRTLISPGSRYDSFLQGDTSALNSSEKAGMQLFFSARTECSSCHSGFLFTDQKYHNIGLDSIITDEGRAAISQSEEDLGKFKTPGLRNIGLTAPYMHDGRLTQLEDVIEFYNSGGLEHPNKDPRVHPLELTEIEKENLVAFLNSLNDI